jgi:hypothetical protein
MTTPKPDIPATATPTSASNLSQEDQDFYKEPDFNTIAPKDSKDLKDGVVPSPTAETVKLGIKPEPKVDVAAAPVAAATTTNGKTQETPITPKAEAVITTAPAPAPTPVAPTSHATVATTTIDPTDVTAVTAALAAAVNSTDDVDMTLAPGTAIEEMNLVLEESIDDDSDPDEGIDSRHLKPSILFTISHKTTEIVSTEREGEKEKGMEGKVAGRIATKNQGRRV